MKRRYTLLALALLPVGLISAAVAPNSTVDDGKTAAIAQAKPALQTRPSAPATRPARLTADTLEHYPAPPAPPLTTDEALKSFTLPPGFHIEVVASEPDVQDPVTAAFDADGRLWVAEMRGYMPDAYAHNEDQPNGRIVVLECTHNDGHFDKKTIFLDHLYLPRAISPVDGGVLVGSPPHLWLCRSTKGDLHCDQQFEINDKYGIARDPEYGDNGLLWARDNWIYNANSVIRFRYLGGDKFQTAPTAHRGQWGITQDDVGRLYFNYNSDQLRCDLIPTDYLSRNPHYKAAGGNVQIEKDQHVWSNRPNPGINRGYEPGNLRKDGHLNTVTATCGPTIFRGTALGEDCYGNAFIPEPVGNLVMRKKLIEANGNIKVQNVLHEHDGQTLDFLCSTDERFRPVNTFTGPDGALYIVDMYRGLIQHRVYLTPYLRNQTVERKLQAPLHWGRIYRVVKDGMSLTKLPHMSSQTPAQWVENLSNPNGWWRDTAQRLLVQKRDEATVPALRKLAVSGRNPLGRLEALWTLSGMDRIDTQTLRTAMNDADARVASAAIRLSEPFLATKDNSLLADVLKQSRRADVRLQFVLSISAVPNPAAEQSLADVVAQSADEPYIKDAALSGLGGRELNFLQRVIADSKWQSESKGRASVLSGLASCIFNQGNPQSVATLVDLITSQKEANQWRQSALLDGLASIAKAPGRKPRVALKAIPTALLAMENETDKRLSANVKLAASILTWPGKPDDTPKEMRIVLNAKQQESFDRGKILFGAICAQCHQPDGKGMEGKAPSLRESPFALGPENRLIRIVLNGAKGQFHVQGWTPNIEMPTLAVLSDEQIADLLTYVRHEWDHNARPITASSVTRVRREVGDRQAAWTEKELLAIPAGNSRGRRNALQSRPNTSGDAVR